MSDMSERCRSTSPASCMEVRKKRSHAALLAWWVGEWVGVRWGGSWVADRPNPTGV